jgi:hypothetical protein
VLINELLHDLGQVLHLARECAHIRSPLSKTALIDALLG